ncbi:hypothetical protein NP493_848g00069 [Ridgeia piscesae]|uniref:Solute-binding protein family 3/N-terminal domain-containing protein n=1 Tax=Ridgeia piscesae TaxID=27915 RepID=A0AAD9KME4_RIDPI|nr:hypothetical protein NP493_848g00069 [Ridgeia piscesae]
MQALAAVVPPPAEDHRIYAFAFGGNDKPHDFVDEETGMSMGLAVDVMREACQQAGKNCVTVSSSACYDNTQQYSLGLNSRWYDVCGNYYHTVDRGRSYHFIGAYGQEPAAFIYAGKGSSISSVDTASQKIGVHGSFWINGECLKRQGMKFKTVVIKNTFDDLKTALDNGDIDVAFLSESVADGYKKLGSKISCAKTGPAFMMRKDMANVMQWYDDAVRKVVASDDFKRMCSIAKKAYGGDPMCLEE